MTTITEIIIKNEEDIRSTCERIGTLKRRLSQHLMEIVEQLETEAGADYDGKGCPNRIANRIDPTFYTANIDHEITRLRILLEQQQMLLDAQEQS